MRRGDLKKILIDMIKKGESERTTSHGNKYVVEYLDGADEYLIGRNDRSSQILNTITYTDCAMYPASEIDRLTKKVI